MTNWKSGVTACLLAVAGLAQAAPTVRLTSPAANAVFATPATVPLAATATVDSGRTVKKVDFYRGTTLIGSDTTAPYSVTWPNPAAGSYSLTAKVTDSANRTATSAAVAIVVDTPPTVSLSAPAANTVVNAGSSLTVSATAADADGTIAKVDFYQGTTLIGSDTTAPYSVTWNAALVGSYSLTAKATDNRGVVTTSSAVPVVVNAAPTVALTSPGANQAFATPATITLAANAADADGTVAKVEFYQGGTLLGTATAAPYQVTWANPPAGSYALTAKATDNRGAVTTSSAVPVVVDVPPTVTLTAPAAGSVVNPGQAVTLTATAGDLDGTISKIDFYQGGTLLGTATSAPYQVTWPNPPAGSYALTAQATDDRGVVTTSPAVAIRVNAAPTVTLTSPAPGATLKPPLTLTASAADADGTLTQVAFYQGGTLIGTATAAPYQVTWPNPPAGSYQLTAQATDHDGSTTTSAPVALTVLPAGTSVYYLHTDHLGTPRAVTDAQATVVWRAPPLAEPFGLAPPDADPDANGVPFTLNLRFPGQYFDGETNLHYNYYRDYDPATGRYIQSDPIGLRGGINTYLYVDANPLSKVDPLGLDSEVCVRPIQGYIIPGEHCFVRFNGNDNDTMSFDPNGVHPDPTPKGATCEATKGPQNDDCVKREMMKCQDYNFLKNNCCHCAEQALKACGQEIPVKKWPNWPINPGPQRGEPGYKP